jgi:hypothetical protein
MRGAIEGHGTVTKLAITEMIYTHIPPLQSEECQVCFYSPHLEGGAQFVANLTSA